MKIDMHVHLAMCSRCSTITQDEFFEYAKDAVDGVCLTDHDTYKGYDTLKPIADKMGFPLFMGIEIWTNQGHMLVYTVEKMDLKKLGRRPTPEAVIEMAHDLGGVVTAAHPYRSYSPSLGDNMIGLDLDFIEVLNGRTSVAENHMAEMFARNNGIREIHGSDAHVAIDIGSYPMGFTNDITTQEEFIDALKNKWVT